MGNQASRPVDQASRPVDQFGDGALRWAAGTLGVYVTPEMDSAELKKRLAPYEKLFEECLNADKDCNEEELINHLLTFQIPFRRSIAKWQLAWLLVCGARPHALGSCMPIGSAGASWFNPPRNITAVESAGEMIVDLRLAGLVTGAKNQNQCGSCWAFAVVGAVECSYALQNRKLVELSEQQIVDCTGAGDGCAGSNPLRALQAAEQAGFLVRASDYPYKHEQTKSGSCPLFADEVKARAVRGFEAKTIVANEEQFLLALTNGYALAVIVCGDPLQPPLQTDEEGVLVATPPAGGWKTNHAVLLVAAGVTAKGKPYWVIKNSWGKMWGQDGYLRIPRGSNALGIADDVGVFADFSLPAPAPAAEIAANASAAAAAAAAPGAYKMAHWK